MANYASRDIVGEGIMWRVEGYIYGLVDVVVNLGRDVLVRLVTIGRDVSCCIVSCVVSKERKDFLV